MSGDPDIQPIAGAIGAEVSGVDLSCELSADTVASLRQAWLEHLVIFFRDQPLSPERFLQVAKLFGAPVEYPFVAGMDDFPEIIEVKKLEHERPLRRGVSQLRYAIGSYRYDRFPS